MSRINRGRWLLGGIVAGLVMWVLEGLASLAYFNDMQASLQAHGLSMEMNAATAVLGVIVSLIAGLTLVFFYAAARPRFGPGPRTAVLVAAVYWAGGYMLSLSGYHMLGLFPDRMLAMWGAIGLVELIAASLAGGWLYREA